MFLSEDPARKEGFLRVAGNEHFGRKSHHFSPLTRLWNRLRAFPPPSEVVVRVVQLEDSAAGMLVKIEAQRSRRSCSPPYASEEATRASAKTKDTGSVWWAWPAGGRWPGALQRQRFLGQTDRRQAAAEPNEKQSSSAGEEKHSF